MKLEAYGLLPSIYLKRPGSLGQAAGHHTDLPHWSRADQAGQAQKANVQQSRQRPTWTIASSQPCGSESVLGKMQNGAHGKPQWENHNAGLWNSVARSCHPLQGIIQLLRKFLAWPRALVETPSVQKTNNVLIVLKSNFELTDSLKGSWRPPDIQRPHFLNPSPEFGTKDFLFIFFLLFLLLHSLPFLFPPPFLTSLYFLICYAINMSLRKF
ncbi:hypothetical protein HJG60_008903 [Phyllostomus discolor]|uniref:Uncharacterized protein n=1 Tax=Phyllostomus discolor TaxID=89673 RepID=A0A834DI97_9CHIR|nr:hypothetical protein HJG60_008903 [Phyllostomus discolor]